MRRICTGMTAAVVVVTLLSGVACSSTDRTAPRATQRAEGAPLSADRAAAVVAKSALPHTPPGFLWMAQAHTNAMQEVVTHIRDLRAMDMSHRCVALANIARNQYGVIEAGSGVHDRRVYETALSHALARVGCPVAQPLAIMGFPSLSSASAMTAAGMEPTYSDYSDALHTAMTSGSTADEAAANLDAVVASATDLSQVQHDTLAALASLGASSAYYWYDMQINNGYSTTFEGDITQNNPEIIPTFLFMSGPCGTWCKAGWADLGAGLLAAETLVGSILAATVVSATTIIADS